MIGPPKPPHALNLALISDSTFGTGQTKGQKSFLLLLVESSLYGLIVSAPAASVNAAAVGLLARRGRDNVVWTAISGTVLGLAFGIYASWTTTGGLVFEFGWITIKYMLMMSAFYVLAALTLALCYWWIAIRPLRQWRLRMESGRDAIRAME